MILNTNKTKIFSYCLQPIQQHVVVKPRTHNQTTLKCIATQQQTTQAAVKSENQLIGMSEFLDKLKWNDQGLATVIVQHVDTGEVLMQAYADRNAICETLQTKLGTFYSRSRGGRWVKGETSSHFLNVINVFMDCDRDSVIYVVDPVGPSCHTGARTCWFKQVDVVNEEVFTVEGQDGEIMPRSTLLQLEHIIQERREAMENPENEGQKPSWTAKLLTKPDLLCSKIREEAGELCETLEKEEGPERCASEMADVLYHSMVLLNKQGVKIEDVLRILRGRFGVSGIDEKAGRKK
eukprot:TRINITY_DN31865_c0_g1_i1.p1 TRINITY_DN31865_c0_g1~~TRINITY_DN31865_c0_g1_i1.p1  ORF type:complete len:293 (+),score=23.60 TRINITY_DN31865_c0_g1_i1:13-891(+)